MVSPFYIAGGVVCWLEPVPHATWFSDLLGTLTSVFIGLLVIIGSGLLAVLSGLGFAIEAAINTRPNLQPTASTGGAVEPSFILAS